MFTLCSKAGDITGICRYKRPLLSFSVKEHVFVFLDLDLAGVREMTPKTSIREGNKTNSLNRKSELSYYKNTDHVLHEGRVMFQIAA